jgi:polyisoprenyl-teichoic acid--peptidoglycan teichoic acid transferase
MTNSRTPPELDRSLLIGASDVADLPVPERKGGPPADASPRLRRGARWLQVLGVLVVASGLLGFWLSRDLERTPLSEDQRALLGLAEGEAHLSFVIAGRDRLYLPDLSTPVYNAQGAIVGWNYRGPRGLDGVNTDTILYVSLRGHELTLIAIPRDLYLESLGARINVVHYRHGAEGLREVVGSLLGLPVDYHLIINLDIFQHVVDALGGVEVNVPYRMRYVDVAGGLDINLQSGPQRLNGAQAADFVRYRATLRGDYDRIDRIKTLAFAMLAQVRGLGVRAFTVIPDIVDALLEDIETNASPALMLELLPRLARLQMQAATLPTVELEEVTHLYTDPREVERFLAATFGGEVRAWREAPAVTLHIVDRSGRAGVGEAYHAHLVEMGVPASRLLLSSGASDPGGTRLVAVADHWQDADYYVDLFGVGKQQIDRLPLQGGREVGMELILGFDAAPPYRTEDLMALWPVAAGLRIAAP